MTTHHSDPHPRAHGAPMRLATMFSAGSGFSLLVLAFILMLIGIGTDVWSTKTVELDDFDNLVSTRGLWTARLYNGYATHVTVWYRDEDINGQERDPYCGDASALSFFAQYIPIITSDPNIPGLTYLPAGVCCGEGAVFDDDRSDESNDWCDIKKSTQGLTIASVILIGLAVLMGFIGRWTFVPMLITAMLGAIVGLAASATFGSWVAREDDDIEDMAFPVDVDVDAAFSFALFTAGWIIALAGSILLLLAEIFRMRDRRNHKKHQPTPPVIPPPVGAGPVRPQDPAYPAYVQQHSNTHPTHAEPVAVPVLTHHNEHTTVKPVHNAPAHNAPVMRDTSRADNV